ncbi:MAG TPA: hypothetical protein ENF75_02945 [Acidilobales archaeon]|nr:hypothetical protein [Acidilobales archaeon]
MVGKGRVKERVLELLSKYPEGLLQSSIHKALGISKSRSCEVLKELESLGLISRVKVGNQYIIKLVRKAPSEEVEGVVRVLTIGIVWSSEYPFLTPYAKLLRERYGIDLRIKVYPNALQATWALVNGELDLVLSPLITQLYAYALTKGLRVIGGGAYGGASLMEVIGGKAGTIASSELSTMDCCRAIVLREGLADAGDIIYFTKPEEILHLVKKGLVRYVVVWHPLTDYLASKVRVKEIIKCSDVDVSYCCTLAASTKLSRELRRGLALTYLDALSEFKRDPKKCIEWYSAKVSIPKEVVEKGLKTYGLRAEIDKGLVSKLLSKVGINLPAPTKLGDAIETYY